MIIKENNHLETALKFGLFEDEYFKIEELMGRAPNMVELGMFSVMWSEHCAYKNSRPLLKLLPKVKKDPEALGQVLVAAGEENAGVIDIGDGWAICFKIESHNHPSAVEPFEGAATGVGGILRDIFTMGARPVLLTNSLRFGDLSSPKTQKLLRGVVHGIAAYGNCVGIPNVAGDTYFDACYEGNPLVNALCLGLLRHDQIKRGAATGVGNLIYYVGPPTGRDGMGGASFASKVLSAESHKDRPAVQKGDPFMEKLLMESCLELMSVPGLVVGIQDMGAGGLTCALSETAARGGVGIEADISKVPQRETGMTPFEIMLSESQERMLVVIEKGREREIESIFTKWDLHAVCIGKVIEEPILIVKHGKETVARITPSSLVEEAPVYERDVTEPKDLAIDRKWDPKSIPDLDAKGIEKTLIDILCHPTIADKRWIWRQYDHMVLASTVVEPGSDAGVVRLRVGNGHEKYLAISNDCNNRYCALDPYKGAQIAVLECIRNLTCSGARPLGMTNNLNFGNPYKNDEYYYLKESVRGLAAACEFFDIPVVGGNVSLYNEHADTAIDPTPVVSIAGIIDKKEHIIQQRIQRGDEALILLGGWPDELGGSYFLKVVHDLNVGEVPQVDLERAVLLHAFVLDQIEKGVIEAAHDISEGGLLVAVIEMIFRKGQFGIDLDLTQATSMRKDALLFGESQNRIIIGCNAGNVSRILEAAKAINLPANLLGLANQSGEINLNLGKSNHVSWNTHELKKRWRLVLPAIMDEHL